MMLAAMPTMIKEIQVSWLNYSVFQSKKGYISFTSYQNYEFEYFKAYNPERFKNNIRYILYVVWGIHCGRFCVICIMDFQ